jgi:hypothetical protein
VKTCVDFAVHCVDVFFLVEVVSDSKSKQFEWSD